MLNSGLLCSTCQLITCSWVSFFSNQLGFRGRGLVIVRDSPSHMICIVLYDDVYVGVVFLVEWFAPIGHNVFDSCSSGFRGFFVFSLVTSISCVLCSGTVMDASAVGFRHYVFLMILTSYFGIPPLPLVNVVLACSFWLTACCFSLDPYQFSQRSYFVNLLRLSIKWRTWFGLLVYVVLWALSPFSGISVISPLLFALDYGCWLTVWGGASGCILVVTYCLLSKCLFLFRLGLRVSCSCKSLNEMVVMLRDLLWIPPFFGDFLLSWSLFVVGHYYSFFACVLCSDKGFYAREVGFGSYVALLLIAKYFGIHPMSH